MESARKFRDKLNKCSAMLQDIALLKGEEAQKNESAKKNNMFFNAFIEYTPIIESYRIMKIMDSVIVNGNEIAELKSITDQINNTFETKQVINPANISNAIKKLNARWKEAWEEYSEELTKEMIDQLEIFYLVCNNKKEMRDIIMSIKAIKEWPLNENNYKKYSSNIDKAHKQIENVHFDAEIEVFLRKLKDRTATLLDLNDKILAWIRENNLNNNILLTIRHI